MSCSFATAATAEAAAVKDISPHRGTDFRRRAGQKRLHRRSRLRPPS